MKGRPWCADMPVVTVPAGEPKLVTYIVPYYENPTFFRFQLARWGGLLTALASHLSIIVVDDGSPNDPAANVLGPHDVWPNRLRLFRLEQDVRWNWLAARNIGAHEAEDGWLLLTDMDHVVPTVTMAAAVTGQHDPGIIYGFSRKEHTGEAITPHPNSWLMTRRMFWKVGGYDEALSGHYGTDGDWRRRMAKVAPIHILTDHLRRYERMGDSSTVRYLRKQPEDAAVKQIVAARRKGWRPKTLSFPYHEVTLTAEALADHPDAYGRKHGAWA